MRPSLVAVAGLLLLAPVLGGCASEPPVPVTKTAAFESAATPPPSPAPRKRVVVPSGVTAGYVVFDRQARRVTVSRNVHKRFRSASVVKLLIAIDHLEDVAKPDLAVLRPMLRVSDDDAATALWRRGGQGKIILRMAKRLKLTDTSPPPADKPGFWGYTAISALDIAKVYRYLLEKAEPKVRDTIMGELRKAEPCGSDGFDQYFGIPRAVPRPWAVKQGWSGYGSVPPSKCVRARTATADVDFVHPVLHTTGVIGDRYIMVLLTTQTTAWADATKKITKLARDVYRAAPGS
ncbi:hypothetical protein [Acrocarpospora catenulata]|uniref:hypothetical protein n=1 Tax=Acrocarpospora catenulata TaxID=2836182 RepID=UPI001BD92859|nr:hypothetical protein [Acrocarpospora catenulata]